MIVTEDGQVFDRQMDLPRDYSQTKLAKRKKHSTTFWSERLCLRRRVNCPLGASGVHDDLFRMVMAKIWLA